MEEKEIDKARRAIKEIAEALLRQLDTFRQALVGLLKGLQERTMKLAQAEEVHRTSARSRSLRGAAPGPISKTPLDRLLAPSVAASIAEPTPERYEYSSVGVGLREAYGIKREEFYSSILARRPSPRRPSRSISAETGMYSY